MSWLNYWCDKFYFWFVARYGPGGTRRGNLK
jgi:hypothetical protein